jgi:hypothetical protein
VVGAIMTVKAATYGLVLVTSTIYVAWSGTYDTLAPFYAFVFLGGVIAVSVLLRNMYAQNHETPANPANFLHKAHP